MNEQTKLHLIALYSIDGIGDKSIATLIEHYNSIENIFADDEAGIINTIKNALSRQKKKDFNFSKTKLLEKAKRIVDDSQKRGIEILTIFDKDYPFNLKQINNPPYILYIKGNKKVLRRNCISVVGTRKPQKSSMDYAFELGSVLSAFNITVVSGFASGVDTAAHLGALSANGNTIAVFGCGLDNIYPSENARIYDKMIEHSLIISEFPVGTRPDRQHFPRRNRIISALSYATVMVEAASRSGALITTNYALEQGRDVIVAPYDESKSYFFGNHKLYKDGAMVAKSGMDIIKEFDHIFSMDNNYVKMKHKYFEGGNIVYEGLKQKNSNNNKNNPKKREILAKENLTNFNNNNNVDNTITSDENIVNINSDDKIEEKQYDFSTFSSEEKAIFDVINESENIHIDDIARKVNISIDNISMTLMQLEIKGIIKQNPGKYYVLDK